jgi:hypothetical protein
MASDITSEEDEFYGKDGPLRYSGWARDSLETACHDIDQVLPKIGARRMIMGHTTTPTAVSSA